MASKQLIDIPTIVHGMRQVSEEKDQIKWILGFLAPWLRDYLHNEIVLQQNKLRGGEPQEVGNFIKLEDGKGNVLGCWIKVFEPMVFEFRLYFHDASTSGRALAWGSIRAREGKISTSSEGIRGDETISCLLLLERLLEKVRSVAPETFDMDLDIFYAAAKRAPKSDRTR